MGSVRHRGIQGYLREWGLMAVGVTAFVWSLPLYLSWSNRPVLGRWSYSYFILLVAAAIAWFAFLVLTWRFSSRASAERANSIPPSRKLFGLSALCWGLAYLYSALNSSASAGRIMDLNLVGSTLPTAAALEWIAIATFVLASGIVIGPNLPPRWQGTGLAIATIAFVFVVGEALARAKAVVYPQTQGFPTYSGELWSRSFVQINSRGFRDEERSIRAGDGIRRALVVGDSFAFGVGIRSPAGRFGEQFRERLNSNTTGRWEVINASLGDTNTLDHIDFLGRMLDMKPDLVVLIYVFNDINYLAPVTHRDPIASSGFSPGRVVFLNSYLFQELYVRLRKIWFSALDIDPLSTHDDNELLQLHLADLGRFVSMAHEHGSSVRIVPFHFQVGDQQRAGYRRFVEQAETFGLPVCSLEGAFDQHPIEDLRVNSLDGHPNAFANGLAVEAAFDCLSRGVR